MPRSTPSTTPRKAIAEVAEDCEDAVLRFRRPAHSAGRGAAVSLGPPQTLRLQCENALRDDPYRHDRVSSTAHSAYRTCTQRHCRICDPIIIPSPVPLSTMNAAACAKPSAGQLPLSHSHVLPLNIALIASVAATAPEAPITPPRTVRAIEWP